VAKCLLARSLDIGFVENGGGNNLIRMKRKGVSNADRKLGANN
jgi:hypothetical protein